MDAAARRRLAALHSHFNTSLHLSQQHDIGNGGVLDTKALQFLLDHDNHQARAAMKQLMCANDIFLPYV